MREERIALRAEFDPKLKLYWWINGIFLCVITVIGWPFLPFWLLGLGQYICRRSFKHMQCDLTERGLHVRKGYLFRTEKNIPLDKIQDLTLHEGPLLRWLGLATLKVETAGASAPQGQAAAGLAGIVDAPAFRDAVIDQRDRLLGYGDSSAGSEVVPACTTAPVAEDDGVLIEIRDSLHRIERLLEKRP